MRKRLFSTVAVLTATVLLAGLGAPAVGVPVAAASSNTFADAHAAGAVWRKAAGLDSPRGESGTVGALADSVADAVPLPASPVTGNLATTGDSDLYAIDVDPGARIELSLTAASGGFDLYLFAPGLGFLSDTMAVAHASEGPYPRTLTYDVPIDLSGTYYVEVYAWQGSGDYTLSWNLHDSAERARTDVGTAVGVVTPYSGSINLPDALQANAVFSFAALAGNRLYIDMSGPADADFDLHLYAPGTTTILPSYVEPVASSSLNGSTERIVFDVPAGAGGTYILEVLRFNGTGNATIQITSGSTPPGPSVTRVSGSDRYATAAEISATSFPAGSAFVVLASGASFPDGLSAASLAGALNAPILLSKRTELPERIGLEIQRLGASTVYIVGGSGAVGYDVESDIMAYAPGATVRRVAGGSRYETATEIADKVHEVTGVRPDRVFLASGERFPDALSLSPVAFATKSPILLTRSGVLPPETAAAITRLRGPAPRVLDMLVAGGTGVVSGDVAAQASALAGGSFARAAGSTRYDTALNIAEHAMLEGWADPATLAIASGANFPDALGGAPLPGRSVGVLLLSPVTKLGPASASYLKSFDFHIQTAWVLGGSSAIHADVLHEMDAILPDVAPLH